MSREEVSKSLDRLRSEINKLDKGDELVKKHVDELIGELEHQLEHSGDPAHKATLIESLRKFVEQFETEHPRVTGILNHIMVTLGNMGV